MINRRHKIFSVNCLLIMMFLSQTADAKWVSSGGPAGGHVIDMAQGDSGIVYAAVSNSGIFRSTDHGVNWTQTDSSLTIGDMSAITVFGKCVTVYTLHDDKYFSNDGGVHWKQLAQGSDNQVFKVVEGSNGEIYVLGYFMFSRSTDSGASWKDISRISDAGGSPVTPMVVTGNGTLIRGGTNITGIVRSKDHGVSWSDPDTTLGKINSLGRRNTGEIFAVGEKGFFHSNDSGSNWIKIDTDYPFTSFTCLTAASSGELYIGSGRGILRSSDSAKSWIFVNNGIASTNIQSLVASSDGVIYAGTYGAGVFTSVNKGDSWTTPLSGPLTSVYSLAVVQSGEMLAGTFASGIFRSFDFGTTWARSTNGLPVNISSSLIASNRSGEVFASTDSGLFRSFDNGEMWSPVNSAMYGNKKIQELVFSGTGNVVAATENSIYYSQDHGSSWTASNNGQTFPSIWALTADVDSIVYAGTAVGLFRSDNGGIKWVSAGSGLPGKELIMAVSVTPDHSVLAATSEAGMYRSIDRGANWVIAGNGAQDSIFVHSVISDGNGNCFGCLRNGPVGLSTDNGLSWTEVDSGLPETIVYSLAICGGQLFVATNNFGVWRRPLSEMTGVRREYLHGNNNKTAVPEISSAHGDCLRVFITFTLSESQNVNCSVYSLSGRRMAALADSRFTTGKHSLLWSPKNASGCYMINTVIGTVSSKSVITLNR